MRIKVHCQNRIGILRDILNLLVEYGINVARGEVGGEQGNAIYLHCPNLINLQFQSLRPKFEAISGVFGVEPLIHTSLNTALGLDAATARALSPIHWPAPNGGAPGGRALDCWVGGAESNEFIRQSRSMAAEWGGKGADTHVEVLDGLDHFTMLDPLADKDSAMVRRLVALATAE